ncbi:hypothetical protein HanRHA438_Chr11g0501081 [Helianthus annuus]|nr:hypothetical protein HanRHA438_Chr11g0501081 [Helianthus annuus]
MSPPGMVRVRHFEFLCHSHGVEPSVDKFRAFYQLQRTMGFFSFASRGAAKKILLNPPKSFHDWKPKFFFIREEVLPIAMPFRDWTEAYRRKIFPSQKLLGAGRFRVLKIGDHGYEESVGSSSGELSSWSKIFAGVLRDLGIYPEEKKKKPVKRKKKVEPEVTSKGTGPSRATSAAVKGTLRLRQRDLDDYVIISDSYEGLSHAAKGKTGAGGSKSSGSAGSRNPEAGATPSFPEDEEVEEEDAGAHLIGRKRGRSEATTGVASAPTSVVIPVVGENEQAALVIQIFSW